VKICTDKIKVLAFEGKDIIVKVVVNNKTIKQMLHLKIIIWNIVNIMIQASNSTSFKTCGKKNSSWKSPESAYT
jgi:hypothetical protein